MIIAGQDKVTPKEAEIKERNKREIPEGPVLATPSRHVTDTFNDGIPSFFPSLYLSLAALMVGFCTCNKRPD